MQDDELPRETPIELTDGGAASSASTSSGAAMSVGYVAVYQTAKSLGNNPRTLADETQTAFSRALTLGTGTAQTQPEPPCSG